MEVLCDELFGCSSFVAQIVWQKRCSRENRESIGDVHEYILVYAKNKLKFKNIRNLVPMTEQQAKVYKNPNNDPIYFGKGNNSQPNKITYLSEVPGVAPWTW